MEYSNERDHCHYVSIKFVFRLSYIPVFELEHDLTLSRSFEIEIVHVFAREKSILTLVSREMSSF